jgi:hypothetical protein
MAGRLIGGRLASCVFVVLAASTGVLAQQTPSTEDQDAVRPPSDGMAASSAEAAQDPLGPPTELGIRLTPEIARAIAKRFVQQAASQYQLDAAKHDEAAELIARRLMAAAHAAGGKGNDLVEWALTRAMNLNVGGDPNGRGSPMTPEFQKELAHRLIPLIPAMKDLVGGVVHDIMPLLPVKQRLKLSGQLLLAGTALQAFEDNMKRWERGEGGPNENPFEPPGAESPMVKKDANGEAVALRRARAAAEKAVDREAVLKSVWGSYLADAKKYYVLDAAQCAAGDSLLRECLERARGMLKDPSWRDRYYRVQLWQEVVWRTHMTRNPFFNRMLQQETSAALQPLDALGDEFRARVDDIPTQEQRAAAADRIAAALESRGYTSTQEAK